MSLLIDEAETQRIARDVAQFLRQKMQADVSAAFDECEIAIIRNDFQHLQAHLSSAILHYVKGLTIGQALEVVREARIELKKETKEASVTYRIEASITNPETRTGYERDNINDYTLCKGDEFILPAVHNYLRRNYWVEVYCDATDQKLCGPFDPNSDLPSHDAVLFWRAS